MNIKVENENSLVRDSNSNAILANNFIELKLHREKKSRLDNTANELQNLKNEMKDVKALLQNLLNNYNKDITE